MSKDWASSTFSSSSSGLRFAFDNYYSLAEIYAKLDSYAAASPTEVTVSTIGESHEKKPIKMIVVTDGTWTPGSGVDNSKKIILLDGGKEQLTNFFLRYQLRSTSPRGSVAYVQVYHLEVKGSIPAATMIFFSAGLMILALLSSTGAHNILYSMPLTGIFPATWSHKKCVVCSEISLSISAKPIKKLSEHIDFFSAGPHQNFFLNLLWK